MLFSRCSLNYPDYSYITQLNSLWCWEVSSLREDVLQREEGVIDREGRHVAVVIGREWGKGGMWEWVGQTCGLDSDTHTRAHKITHMNTHTHTIIQLRE